MKRFHFCITALGLSPSRSIWGMRPLDVGIRASFVPREEWHKDTSEENGHHHHPTWFNTKFYHIPRLRHLWGDSQYEVHAGAQELFLDLVFVGVAYQVGVVLKDAFYSCRTDSSEYGSGYNGSPQPVCVGLWNGIVHALAPFFCMYMLWGIETKMRAQFAISSKVHYVLDALSNLLLIFAGMNMVAPAAYREQRAVHGLANVLVPLLVDFAIWIARLVELALFARRDNSRRQSSAEVVICIQVLAMWVAAYVLLVTDFSDPVANARASDTAAALMWFGSLWWVFKQAWRCVIELWLHENNLAIERAFVCSNMGFVFHRNNEFMFLMLGETVLQIVIGVSDGYSTSSAANSLFNQKMATATASFILAGCMLYSFRAMVAGQLGSYERTNEGLAQETEEADYLMHTMNKTGSRFRLPNDTAPVETGEGNTSKVAFTGGASTGEGNQSKASEGGRKSRLMSSMATRPGALKKIMDTRSMSRSFTQRAQASIIKMRLYNLFNALLWQAKALAIMLVGVAVKLAIYKPDASPDEHFAAEQRLELAVPSAIVFFIQLLHCIAVKNRHHYSCGVLLDQPQHVCVLLGRVGVLIAMVALSVLRVQPLAFLWLQAGLAVVQCALSHVQDFKYPISSPNAHPMRIMPQALHALHQCRVRARDEAGLSV